MSSIFISILTIINSFFSFTTSGTCASCPLDLLVNGQHNPPHVVVLDDLKPGDEREVPKDLYANCTSKAKIYMHLKDVNMSQGTQTEPEVLEENGSPKDNLPDYIYYDLKLGNTPLISLTDKVRFSDAVSCWIPIGVINPKVHVPLYQSFHFDADVTNWAQGDKSTFTEEFLAVLESNNELPDTGSGRIWDPTLKKCVPGVIPTPIATPTHTPKPTHTPRPSPTPKPTATPRPTKTPTPTPTIRIRH